MIVRTDSFILEVMSRLIGFSFSKRFIIVLFTLLLIHSSSAQEKGTCAYSGYIPEAIFISEHGLQTVSLNEKMEIFVDNIVSSIGIERKFFLKEAEDENIAATIFISPDSLNRYVTVPSILLESDKDKYNSKEWTYLGRMLHSIGHQVYRQILIELTKGPDQELIADWFSGFVMGKLGASKEESHLQLDGLLDITLKKENFPQIKQRELAITDGRNYFLKTQSALKEESSFKLYSFNQKEINKNERIALDQFNNENKNIVAQAWLNAFRHSNGLKIGNLYNAFYFFTESKNSEKTIECGLELLLHGINFLNKKAHPSIYKRIGEAYLKLNDLQNALKYFLVAVKLDEKNVDSYLGLAEINKRNENWDGQITHLKSVIKAKPDYVQVYHDLGLAYLKKNDTQKAITILKRVLVIDKDFLLARLELAKIYTDLANQLYTPLIRNKKVIESKVLKKKTRKATRNLYNKAIEILEKGLDIRPESMSIVSALKKIHETIGDKKKVKLLEEKYSN